MSARANEPEHDAQVWAAPVPTRGLAQIVWQRKPLVILAVLVGLGVGTLLYAQRAPVYQSSAQVFVVKKGSNALPVASDPRLTYIEDYLTTHVMLLRSPLIIQEAVKKRGLDALKSFEGGGDPVGTIKAGLTVSRDESTGSNTPSNILNLSYRGSVPEDCGKILTAILESYQDFLDLSYRRVNDQGLDMITKARDLLQKDLRVADQKYRKFIESSPLLWKGKDGSTLQQDQVVAIEKKRADLRLRQAELKERIAALEKAIAEGRGREVLAILPPGREGKMSAAERALEQQLLPLLLHEQKLLEDYGDDHPEVRSIRKRIAFTRDFIKRNLGGADGAEGSGEEARDPVQKALLLLKHELREAEVSQQAMAKMVDDLKEEARSLGSYELEEQQLRNDIVRLQQLHEGAIKRLAELNLVRDSGGFDARTIAPPGPGVKVAPSAMQSLLAGLMLGLLAGVGLAYLADISDKSFRTPEEVRRRLGLPLVGHVPFLKPDPETLQRIAAGEPLPDPLLCTYYRPKSVEAEAYRAVRTALYFSTQGEGHKVIQVTSPNKGDGKSLLIANLAISIAQSGKRVLLIDADCRRPRQHKVFNIPARAGLASVIGGQDEPGRVIQETAVSGLWLMPCGPIPPNPAELLTSPRFKDLLDEMRERYDFVLIDTPPLLAVTDPCVVAPRVDGLFLTLRLSRQGRPNAERAKEILVPLGVNILGVVINGVTRRGGSGGLYAAEQYDYSESYGDDEEGDPGAYYTADEPAEPAGAAPSEEDTAPPLPAPKADDEGQGVKPADPPGRGRSSGRRGGSRGGLFSWLLSWWA
jgi:capsular exopolysaccharide synthesis family protein